MKLSNNISLNKKTALTHLDLSNNHLDDKGFYFHVLLWQPIDVRMILGFELLAGALEGLPHGLVIFSLANCALSSRAAGLLSSAMLKNSHFASSLNKSVYIEGVWDVWLCSCEQLVGVITWAINSRRVNVPWSHTSALTHHHKGGRRLF